MRLLGRNIISVFIACVSVLICMFALGPEETLDAHLFYTAEDAHRILYAVSLEESAHYFRLAMLDMLFIFLYSCLLWMMFQKLKLSKWNLWFFALAPGIFDLIETSHILYALTVPGSYHFLSWLGYVTFIKWALAFISLSAFLWFFYTNVREWRISDSR